MAWGPFGDPIFLGLMAALLLFFGFIYLMLRRAVVSFKEGFKRGRG